MKRLLLTSIIAFVVLNSCVENVPANSSPTLSPVTLPTASISSEPTITETDYPATIQGAVDVEIRPQINGIIERIFVDEGSYVNKGQSLFKITEKPYREQLNTALANLHAQEATLINAQLEVEKLSPLVDNKVISDYQLKTAKAAVRIAEANIAQAKALVEAARINLNYTNVVAPVSGYIGRLPKKQGSLVAPTDAEPLTTLSDVHEVYAYFSLSESDFIKFKDDFEGYTLPDKLKKLPPVKLLLSDNEPYEYSGKIDMVDGQFDKSTGAITLRATFSNKNGILRSGNTGKVRLGLQHTDAILIPQSATVEMQDKIFVFALSKDNKVSKTPITIRGKSGTYYIIKEGLKTGDQIVLSGIDKLQEGQVIQPEKKPSIVAHINTKK